MEDKNLLSSDIRNFQSFPVNIENFNLCDLSGLDLFKIGAYEQKYLIIQEADITWMDGNVRTRAVIDRISEEGNSQVLFALYCLEFSAFQPKRSKRLPVEFDKFKTEPTNRFKQVLLLTILTNIHIQRRLQMLRKETRCIKRFNHTICQRVRWTIHSICFSWE